MAEDIVSMESWKAKCPNCGCKLEVEWQLAVYGEGGDSPQFVGLKQVKSVPRRLSFLARRGDQPSKRVRFTTPCKRVASINEQKHEIVQLPNPKTKRWVKIDKTTGSIISHKMSPGAYAGITIALGVKCDCTHMKKQHYLSEGQCGAACGCTWFHPALEYCKPLKGGKG